MPGDTDLGIRGWSVLEMVVSTQSGSRALMGKCCSSVSQRIREAKPCLSKESKLETRMQRNKTGNPLADLGQQQKSRDPCSGLNSLAPTFMSTQNSYSECDLT